MEKDNDIVMVSAARTPFGRYGGSLKDFDYFDLGAIPMKEVLKRVNLDPKAVDEVFWVSGIHLFAKMYTLLWQRGRPY